MNYETIFLDHRDRVSTIALNRPPLNSISLQMLNEVSEGFDYLTRRAETRCVVITATGKTAFSSGGDVNELSSYGPMQALDYRKAARALLDQIETSPKPVLAAIRGQCASGGVSLALTCDIRVASESAIFSIGDIYGGTSPSWSFGMVRLVHYIGRNRTLDLLLLGEKIAAEKAYELGLVSKVTVPDQFEAEVRRISDRLASAAPLTLRAVKEAVRSQWWDSPSRAALIEEESIQRTFRTNDAQEGIMATMEKGVPHFTGQ